jgi:DNA polymerase family A
MLEQYHEIWLVDFEFIAGNGMRPDPVCLVAHELHSGRTIRLWRDQFGPTPPYSTESHALFVAYYASAEVGCHLALGWPKPNRVLDLFTEFRAHTNGLATVAGAGLIGALTHFGLDTIGAEEKDGMRKLILRGGPWAEQERADILDYCESDVVALQRLLPAMLPHVDLPRALLRGRYMAAAAAMEHNGIPLDVATLERLRLGWTGIQDQLIAAIDAAYSVYEGRTFKHDRFAAWLAAHNIPWPRLDTGKLDLEDDTFRQMARAYPAVSPLRELRSSLADLRLSDLTVGPDGRNRCLLSAFRSKTSRNQPSNSKFIFGPSVWIRGLIKPPPGYAVAYIDWSQQEIGIAAALSGDEALMDAYRTGDIYLTFAKWAGAVPDDATKESHEAQREQFKACMLGTNYGQGPEALALRIAQPPVVARDLLRAHHHLFRTYWKWSDAAVSQAMLHGILWTVFGWPIRVGVGSNPRSLLNFPMQGNGADMLRLACCLGTERGIEILAPVHDAVLIGAPADRIEADVAAMQACMAEASRAVLCGFELGSEAKVVRYPDRYMDKRGAVMWDRVCELLDAEERRTA